MLDTAYGTVLTAVVVAPSATNGARTVSCTRVLIGLAHETRRQLRAARERFTNEFLNSFIRQDAIVLNAPAIARKKTGRGENRLRR